MGEEDRGKQLPHRVRGAARAGPPPSASSLSPALSEELRRRLHAAVEAERAEAVAQERTTELPRRGTASRPTGGDITTPPVEQTNGHSKQSGKPESAVRSGRVAKPESTTQAQPGYEG